MSTTKINSTRKGFHTSFSLVTTLTQYPADALFLDGTYIIELVKGNLGGGVIQILTGQDPDNLNPMENGEFADGDFTEDHLEVRLENYAGYVAFVHAGPPPSGLIVNLRKVSTPSS